MANNLKNIEHADLNPKLIEPSPFQPRQEFPADEIKELAESIAERGVIVPILVRPDKRCRDCTPRTACRHYELVTGERQLLAVRRLKLPTIRAEVRTLTDAEARAIIIGESKNEY